MTSLSQVPDEVDGGGWDGVEEEADEEDEKEDEQDAQQLPLEVRPDDVLERLPRVHEPQEGRIRSAAASKQQVLKQVYGARCMNKKVVGIVRGIHGNGLEYLLSNGLKIYTNILIIVNY